MMARFDYADDERQTAFLELAGLDTSDLVASIDANEAAIEEAGVIQHSYTASGNDHGIVGDGAFYGMEVNGVTLVDWVTALIAGEPFGDVHCDQCQPTADAHDTGVEQPDDQPTDELLDELTVVADCMRAKGYDMADPTVDDQGHVMLRPPLDEAPTQDQIDKQDADFEACKEQVGLEAPPSTDGE